MISKNKFLLTFLFFLVCPPLLSAQPRGDEPQKIRALVVAVLNEISEVDEKIAQDQNDANFYGERGKLYVKLYRTLYLTPYLSSFYREKSDELSLNSITTKAIKDFNKAILAESNAEILKLRGEMYALRWFDYASKFDWRDEIEKLWREKIQKIGGQEWGDIIIQILREDSKREEQIAALQKFFGNSDFDNSRKDFEKALKISANSDLTEEINEEFGRLLLIRVAILRDKLRIYDATQYLAIKWTDLIPPNKFGYSILDDLNQGIFYLKNGNLNKNHESGDIIRQTFYNEFNYEFFLHYYKIPSLNEFLFLKAVIEFNLHENKIALETLDEIERLIDKKVSDEFTCQLYSLRSRVHSKMQNFDAALADANKTSVDSDLKNVCGSAFEPRGDAYFGKGNFQAAIADYNSQLSYHWHRGVLNVDEAEIYKKIRTAYLKLNDKKSAINYSISYQRFQFQTFLERTNRSIELLKIRSQLYRQIGDEKKALEEEKKLKEELEVQAYLESVRSVYGKIAIPKNSKIKAGDVSVKLVSDKTNIISPFESRYSYVLDDGRFYFIRLKNEPFHLYFYFDKIEKNKRVRYYWTSQNFERGNKIFEPLVVSLDKFKKLDSKNMGK